MATNGDYSLVPKDDGTVRVWGHNEYGQLGTRPNGTDRHTLMQQRKLSVIKAIVAGTRHNKAKVLEATS